MRVIITTYHKLCLLSITLKNSTFPIFSYTINKKFGKESQKGPYINKIIDEIKLKGILLSDTKIMPILY